MGYVWVSVSVCVRRAQVSRHEAIKVAEMASQGADTIPRVHRFCLESVVSGHHVYKRVWTPVCCKRSCVLSLLATGALLKATSHRLVDLS